MVEFTIYKDLERDYGEEVEELKDLDLTNL